MTKRYAEAEALRRRFSGCKGMADLAKAAPDTRFEDMKYVKPGSIAEPMRSMLLSAKDDDVLPPVTTAAGIELYAVCGRRPLGGNEERRSRAMAELQSKELERPRATPSAQPPAGGQYRVQVNDAPAFQLPPALGQRHLRRRLP